MKAVVWEEVGKIQLKDVPEPKLEKPTDAIVRLTASAICGTDLHMIRGTMPGMKKGTILGHEGVGVIESLGKDVRNFQVGDRVVIPSTIACGNCSYCRDGYYGQCDVANPHGSTAGTAFFGGPAQSGSFNGLQAEKALIPYANINLVKIPENVSDEQALITSDIFPTAYFGADMANVKGGKSVAVFGCGPVGQLTIASLKLLNAGRIFAIDNHDDRLEMARAQGAETINFSKEDPVKTILRLTDNIGVDRVVDAVGVDANHASNEGHEHADQIKQIAPKQHPDHGNWEPGNAPSQVKEWAVQCVAKAGLISIIGVYPPSDNFYPIGTAMNKNLTLRMGNCNHRKYIPMLLNIIATGMIDPSKIFTQKEPMLSAIEAYKAFDKREPGWIKVQLEPDLVAV